MRYFFHIVDKHGLYPDATGYEHTDQDAAVRHAKGIATELAKAGEFFRAGFILVSAAAAPGSAQPASGTQYCRNDLSNRGA